MMWDDDNNYTKLFYQWWKTSEYTLQFESEQVEIDFIDKVNKQYRVQKMQIWSYGLLIDVNGSRK